MSLRDKVYDIIFESDTKAGKIFDICLIISIILSVLIVMLDSIESYHNLYSPLFYQSEWFFTILFTIEYALRLWSIRNPLAYATSFYGIIDLLAIIPTYLSILFPGTQYLIVIRVLRVLRIFRVLKFMQYVGEANVLVHALKESRRKIFIFLFSVLTLVIIYGSIMYLVESEANSGFTSIPISVYWAIVTITTVGYGDISPQTPFGQVIASMVMITGYSIIAVPTGIISAEMNRIRKKWISERVCQHCSAEGHDEDATFCKFCGKTL